MWYETNKLGQEWNHVCILLTNLQMTGASPPTVLFCQGVNRCFADCFQGSWVSECECTSCGDANRGRVLFPWKRRTCWKSCCLPLITQDCISPFFLLSPFRLTFPLPSMPFVCSLNAPNYLPQASVRFLRRADSVKPVNCWLPVSGHDRTINQRVSASPSILTTWSSGDYKV